MFTEEVARRLVAILTETVGQPIDQRLERIEKEIPRAPTPANIIMALGPAPHAHRQGSAASDSRDRQCPALPQRGMCREPAQPRKQRGWSSGGGEGGLARCRKVEKKVQNLVEYGGRSVRRQQKTDRADCDASMRDRGVGRN
jgi:hypothetical protein